MNFYRRLQEADFSIRAMKALSQMLRERHGGPYDLWEAKHLIGATEDDFLSIGGCGLTTLRELKDKLPQVGLSFAADAVLTDYGTLVGAIQFLSDRPSSDPAMALAMAEWC
jgi:hypothetical protein